MSANRHLPRPPPASWRLAGQIGHKLCPTCGLRPFPPPAAARPLPGMARPLGAVADPLGAAVHPLPGGIHLLGPLAQPRHPVGRPLAAGGEPLLSADQPRASRKVPLASFGLTFPIIPALPHDHEYTGAFVSLHNGSRLRGCIGRFECNGGVPHTVQKISVAVLSDPRFISRPVTLNELDQLAIEISLLSPMAVG